MSLLFSALDWKPGSFEILWYGLWKSPRGKPAALILELSPPDSLGPGFRFMLLELKTGGAGWYWAVADYQSSREALEAYYWREVAKEVPRA